MSLQRYYCPNCGDYYGARKIISRLIDKSSRSIRLVDALEKIFENLDRIPIEELEKLADKYGL